MLNFLVARLNPISVAGQTRRASMTWFLWFAAILGLTGILGLGMLLLGPNPIILAWMVFFLGIIAIIYQPRYGVYLILFFALLTDGILTPWYPFVKNFSSAESIFYLNGSLIISPLEVYIAVTLISWLGRAAMERKLKFFTGPLFWPATLFTAFWIFGLGFGLAKGGNLNAALWEARPIIYLPIMLVLTSNLMTTREHLNRLMWFIMIDLLIVGIIGNGVYFFQLHGDIHTVKEITEHASAVHMNTLYILILAAWIYRASPAKRFLLPFFVPFVGLTYFATQRRAAFLSLIIALLLMAFILFIEKRKIFWRVVPPILCIFLLYLAAFWHSSSTLALPVEAVKSMVDQKQSSMEDQLSNAYRVLENMNSDFTIHTSPLFGIGFGRKFYIIVRMPDISSFIWWQYITHNSIIWIWMKMGFGGFIAMLILIGTSIMVGVRSLLRMPGGNLSAIALTATLYIVMHFTYAYVDMSWDIRSMLFLGSMMGLLNALEHIAAQPIPIPEKRWAWLPDAKPQAGLKALSSEANR